MTSTLNFSELKRLEHESSDKQEKPDLKPEQIVTEAPSRPVIHAEPTITEYPVRILVQGPPATINRFKKLCKDDRRSYHDMLEILMNSFEQRK